MKKFLLSFFIILNLISVSFAALRFIPLEEAVKENDLIIIGTLKDISETSSYSSSGGITTGRGKILVEQFIAGNVKNLDGNQLKSGDELRLDYIENFACIMGSHKIIENQKGIFLLKINSDGEIESKDFRYLNDLTEINKLLKKKKKTSGPTKTIKLPEKEKKTSDPIKTIKLYEEIRSKDHSPISALFTAMISVLLYYFLYRSNYRIR